MDLVAVTLLSWTLIKIVQSKRFIIKVEMGQNWALVTVLHRPTAAYMH